MDTEKERLRLQVRLIGCGAFGYDIPDNGVMINPQAIRRFLGGIESIFNIHIATIIVPTTIIFTADYLYSQGIRAISQ